VQTPPARGGFCFVSLRVDDICYTHQNCSISLKFWFLPALEAGCHDALSLGLLPSGFSVLADASSMANVGAPFSLVVRVIRVYGFSFGSVLALGLKLLAAATSVAGLLVICSSSVVVSSPTGWAAPGSRGVSSVTSSRVVVLPVVVSFCLCATVVTTTFCPSWLTVARFAVIIFSIPLLLSVWRAVRESPV